MITRTINLNGREYSLKWTQLSQVLMSKHSADLNGAGDLYATCILIHCLMLRNRLSPEQIGQALPLDNEEQMEGVRKAVTDVLPDEMQKLFQDESIDESEDTEKKPMPQQSETGPVIESLSAD